MRCLLPLLPALLLAGAASAQTITVEKGEWNFATDIYLTGDVAGERIDQPADSTSETQCWALDEEVSIDESMLMMDNCEATSSHYTDYALETMVSCSMDGVAMDGSIVMATNADRDMFSGRILIKGQDSDYDIRIEGLIFAQRLGACSAPN